MRLSRSLAALMVVGTAAAGVAAAGPAAARTPGVPGFAKAKAQALLTLDGQLFGLRLDAFVLNSRAVPASDQTALLAPIQADITALTALRSTMRSETTVAGIQADSATLAGYHVTDFVLPQATFVMLADQLQAAASQDSSAGPRLLAAITAAQSAGRDVTSANAAYTDYGTQVAAASSDAQAVHDSAIALIAGGSDNAATFTADRAQLAKAAGELRAAAADSRTISRVLRTHGRTS